jgi:uncharacterized protein YndB with AHSA1/START domain
MTLAFSAARSVPASPALVWAALTDWGRTSRWMPGVEGMRAEGPLAVGTVLRYTARGAERTSTITALDPERSLTLTSEQPGVRADYRYTLVPEGSGTAVALEADVEIRGALRLLGPVIRGAIAKEDGGQLDRLAATL